MNIYLQSILIVMSVIFFMIVFVFTRKNKLDISYSFVWFVLTIMYIVFSVFPEIATRLAWDLGIAEPVSAVFLINIAFLIINTFLIYISVSKSDKRIRNLIQEVSLLKSEMETRRAEAFAAKNEELEELNQEAVIMKNEEAFIMERAETDQI